MRFSLDFLDVVIVGDAQQLPREFEQCLDDIGNANQALASDPRFVRLADMYKSKIGYHRRGYRGRSRGET